MTGRLKKAAGVTLAATMILTAAPAQAFPPIILYEDAVALQEFVMTGGGYLWWVRASDSEKEALRLRLLDHYRTLGRQPPRILLVPMAPASSLSSDSNQDDGGHHHPHHPHHP